MRLVICRVVLELTGLMGYGEETVSELAPFLNQLFETYHRREFLSSDPLEFPHRFVDPWDREAVALVSALLAYGRVIQIRRSVENLLERIGASPSALVRSLGTAAGRRQAAVRLEGFVHRLNRGSDLLLLLELLSKSWREHGSLGAHFLFHLDPQDPHFGPALDQLIADWRRWAGKRGEVPSFAHLLTAPRDGSCCKRWCMFLRWMGRKDDSLDLGLWAKKSPLAITFPDGRFLRADQLVLPLDTHTGRISQYLGLTRRKTLGWKAATEITAELRRSDSSDPTRYDFALARLGILDLCQRKYRAEICQRCQLVTACHFAKRGRSACA